MANCTICTRPLSFFEAARSLQAKRCPECDGRLQQSQTYWKQQIPQQFAQGGVTQQTEQTLYSDFQHIKMPQAMAQPIIDLMRYYRNLSEIQWGNLPAIRTDIHLDSDEYPHFAINATYLKQNKEIKYVPGRLIGTNKKMYFVSGTGRDSMTLDWNNVIKVDQYPSNSQMRSQSIHLQVARGSGGGTYCTNDALYAKVLIDTLVRLWKRQIVLYKEQNNKGAIPDHVKSTVFQRDNGRCVQCGYTGPYIEYDHIHPRSKGGHNTVENVQLLCRACNLKKSNRV